MGPLAFHVRILWKLIGGVCLGMPCCVQNTLPFQMDCSHVSGPFRAQQCVPSQLQTTENLSVSPVRSLPLPESESGS